MLNNGNLKIDILILNIGLINSSANVICEQGCQETLQLSPKKSITIIFCLNIKIKNSVILKIPSNSQL